MNPKFQLVRKSPSRSAVQAPNAAAMIMEMVMCNTGVIGSLPRFLGNVRRLCDQHGVILTTDQVVTGVRLSMGGAQKAQGVTGDLGVFAEAMGGGVPIAALTSRRSLMSLIGSGAVNRSGTYNSNTIAV
jgi:glutamate-1-semialdehyde 2,1-aminomutase